MRETRDPGLRKSEKITYGIICLEILVDNKMCIIAEEQIGSKSKAGKQGHSWSNNRNSRSEMSQGKDRKRKRFKS